MEGGGGTNHHAGGGVAEDQRGGVMTGVAEDMKAGWGRRRKVSA